MTPQIVTISEIQISLNEFSIREVTKEEKIRKLEDKEMETIQNEATEKKD